MGLRHVVQIIADVAHMLLVLSNSLVLQRKLRQLCLSESAVGHLRDGWHMFDYVGVAALYVASAAYFTRELFGPSMVVLEQVSLLETTYVCVQ